MDRFTRTKSSASRLVLVFRPFSAPLRWWSVMNVCIPWTVFLFFFGMAGSRFGGKTLTIRGDFAGNYLRLHRKFQQKIRSTRNSPGIMRRNHLIRQTMEGNRTGIEKNSDTINCVWRRETRTCSYVLSLTPYADGCLRRDMITHFFFFFIILEKTKLCVRDSWYYIKILNLFNI